MKKSPPFEDFSILIMYSKQFRVSIWILMHFMSMYFMRRQVHLSIDTFNENQCQT